MQVKSYLGGFGQEMSLDTTIIFRVMKWAAEHKEILPEPTELYQLEKLSDDCWRDFLKEDGNYISPSERMAKRTAAHRCLHADAPPAPESEK